MSVEETRALVHRIYEEFNKGKAAAMANMDADMAVDVVYHGSGAGEEIRGLSDFKQHISEIYDVFPDVHFVLEDMVVEGDRYSARYTWTGTHKGEFMGVPATNRRLTMRGIEIDHIADGKIVELWSINDTVDMMQQLGLIPGRK